MRSTTDRYSVLVVEDEARLRNLMVDVIGDMNFDVHACASAEAALQHFEQDPADILLLDMCLPGMSGLDLLERVKPRFPNTQAIFMTAFGELDSARRAMRLDAVDFLPKPSPLSEIEVAIDRARRRLDAMRDNDEEPIDTAVNELPTNLRENEDRLIKEALERHHGNRSAAARELGISRRTLFNKLRNQG